jgi:DNA polymerase III subunit delta'
VLARASFGPHEGRAKVFIVRNADELSTAAANALLKTLEEPLRRTYFVLITARSAAMLPTVRSRTLTVRFRALAPSVQAARGAEPARNTTANTAPDAAEAAGAAEDSQADASATDSPLGVQLWNIATAPSFGTALEWSFALKKPRSELSAELEGAAVWFAERAKRELQEQGAASRHSAAIASKSPDLALFCAVVHELITQAQRDIDGNAAAQLRLEQLASSVRRALPR